MKKEFKPYYAVIFTSTLTENTEGYNEMAQKMEALAKKQKGFLGIDSIGVSNKLDATNIDSFSGVYKKVDRYKAVVTIHVRDRVHVGKCVANVRQDGRDVIDTLLDFPA